MPFIYKSSLISKKENVSTAPSPYMIDDLSLASPIIAFSVRKLRSGYTGSCIRLRRDNDNGETDIGFDGSGYIDESAITSFVGGNSGFVVIWYDQSGATNNAIQPTSSRQPIIVSSGSIIKNGSTDLPVIKFVNTAVNPNMLYSNTTLDMANASTAGSTSGVCSMRSTGGAGAVNSPIFQFPNTNWGIGIGNVNSSTGYFDGTWRYTNTVTFTNDEQSLYFVHRNSASNNNFFYRMENGNIVSQSFLHGNLNETAAIVTYGNFQLNDATARKDFYMQELIHWPTTNNQTNRSNIFSHMEDSFGT